MLLCLKAWCKWIYRIRQDKVATNKAIKHRIKNKEVKAISELELVKRDRWRRERTLQICLPRRIRINPWVACPITTRAPTGNQVPFYSIKTNWPPKETEVVAIQMNKRGTTSLLMRKEQLAMAQSLPRISITHRMSFSHTWKILVKTQPKS